MNERGDIVIIAQFRCANYPLQIGEISKNLFIGGKDARYSRMQILTMKERFEERSASMSLEIAFFFHKLYITESFQTLKTFLPLDFFKRCFKKTFASSNRKIHRESMKWRARLVPAQA